MGKAVALVYPTHGHITPASPSSTNSCGAARRSCSTRRRAPAPRSNATGAAFRAYEASDTDFNPDPPTDGLLADMSRLLALTERTLPRLLDEIRSEAPDYILIDTKSVWGRLAAEALELPAITLSVVFALTRDHIAVPDLVRMLYGGASRDTLLRRASGLRAIRRHRAPPCRALRRHRARSDRLPQQPPAPHHRLHLARIPDQRRHLRSRAPLHRRLARDRK